MTNEKLCVRCCAPAVKECTYIGQFVCGALLCLNCVGIVEPDVIPLHKHIERKKFNLLEDAEKEIKNTIKRCILKMYPCVSETFLNYVALDIYENLCNDEIKWALIEVLDKKNKLNGC